MKTTRARRVRRAALFAVSAVGVAATVLVAGAGGAVASPTSGGANPIVRIGTRVLSLVPLQSQVTTDFATAHHCSFWAAG